MRFIAILAATSIFFGQVVSDPYRWLEDASSPQTQAWIAAQNARAERVINAFAGNDRIAKRVQELSLTGPQQSEPQLFGNTLFFMREVPPQPQAVLVAQPWPNGSPRVVLDPATLGPNVSIDFVWPSPSGRYIAVATSSGGSELETIRVVSADGHVLSEALGPAGGGTTSPAVAWDSDERGFTYGRLPADGSQFNIKLYQHVVGTSQSTDTLALGAISPIAEYTMLASQNAKQAAALVTFGDGAFQRVYVRQNSRWIPALGPQSGIVSGDFVGNRLLLVATAGTPHGRIAVLQPDGTLQTIVPQQSDWAFHDVAPIRGGFLITESWGTRWRVAHYDGNGRFVRVVALPASGIGIGSIASNASQDVALIEYSGWAGPANRWVAYDGRSGALRTVYDLKPASNAYANVREREISATSADGTRVPVTVLYLAGTRRDGSAPAVLTGYGGFDIPVPPHFIGPWLAWLEMGGVYAVATLRGGSEFGEAWHQQGRFTNKQHVFDDFYASAQALVAQRWTSTSRLGIEGGSNGGLLVGAALVQHPAEYRAVVGEAGIYDTIRHQIFPNGRYNVSEYGNVDNEAQFRAILAYSPYHNVRKGTVFPATLLITSENDPRVASWQSWKFAAALQSANAGPHPILVLTHQTGGHGHGASFAQRVGNTAVMLSFLAAQLGARSD
jgi:prolyl oligopeptidase